MGLVTTHLPMLASASTGASGRHAVEIEDLVRSGDWTLDLKLDGERAFLLPDGTILNRRGVDVTHRFPEIENTTGEWLDGEIVALDGSFETVLARGNQENTAAIKRGANLNPCRFVAFDLPEHHAVDWRGRRNRLERICPDRGQTITVTATALEFFEQTRDLGLEGVIAKRNLSRYHFGRRSKDWVKFKHLHRLTCLIAGYAPGSGSREHLGALMLALIDGDQVVSVGRCGSGFTERQTHDLKARLDAGDLLIAEIETVNLTSGNTLRFPVFRGLRTDVPVTDCTVAQLATLPRC